MVRNCSFLSIIVSKHYFLNGNQVWQTFFVKTTHTNSCQYPIINYPVLDYIEEPPSREFEVEVCDCFIGVLLAFNLQFKDANSNVLVDTLSRRVSVKTFMEKILLLLNREEDPTTIIEVLYQYIRGPEVSINQAYSHIILCLLVRNGILLPKLF